MRRIRQAGDEIPASAAARLACAVVLSAALHAALLVAPAPPSGSRPGEGTVVLHATLNNASPQTQPVSNLAGPVAEQVPIPALTTLPPPVAPETDDPIAPVPQEAASGPGLPQIEDPEHYAAQDLDTYPQLRDSLQPVYPEAALEQRIAGNVTLLVLIDETGKVTEASVIDVVPEAYFAEPARDALQRASFLPATREGRRVRSRILVDVAFDPRKP